MTDLEPCPGCHRHVRLDEATCPFCATALGGVEARLASTTRLSRAAVFAGAALASVAAAGCGGKQTPGPDNQVVENEAATTVVDAAPAPTPDAAPVVETTGPDYDNSCCMPYGAPPMRERLV